MTLPDLLSRNVNEVERLYQAGRVSEQTVRAWIRLWNATPGRFTRAYLSPDRSRIHTYLAPED